MAEGDAARCLGGAVLDNHPRNEEQPLSNSPV